MPSETSIRVRELTKRYPGGTRALRGVSFDAAPAEILSVLGRNGSGKTTSVRILTGLTEPTSGTVEVLGADVVRQRRWVQQRIGVTLQEAAIDDVLTGREFLVLVGRFWGLRRRSARERAAELLAMFGLTTSADRQVRTYSGGMQRRLDIAASLVVLPRVLFLDEPTTGLDPQNRRALWEEIQRLRGQHGMTVLLTTQYLEEAEALADRIAVLDSGRLVAHGTPDQLRRTHGAAHLRITVDGHGAAAALALLGPAATREGDVLVTGVGDGVDAVTVVNELVAAGTQVRDVEIQRDSLEDVFLTLTGTNPGTGDPDAGDRAAGDRGSRDLAPSGFSS